jgi:UDP-N-acetylmuramoyl-L-alanyl-D-glutamate--2,6-diaminopimelate ligase
VTPAGEVEIQMAMIGQHNVYNALAAMAVGYSQGASLDAMKRGIEAVQGVPARMQRVDLGQDFEVFVDYAHTPNALEQVLKLARDITQGKVIVLFGLSGGPRDTSKRPIMGEVAGRLADKIVITSVDWYSQDVGEIMKQIAAGVEQAGRIEGIEYWCERDRKEGIAHAIRLAERGDVVIIAGKGHENVITYGGVDYEWSEIEAAKAGINARLHPNTAG